MPGVTVRDRKSNRQLRVGERQIECERGAISVFRPEVNLSDPYDSHQVTVTAVRGSTAGITMSLPQCRAFIHLLQAALGDSDDPE